MTIARLASLRLVSLQNFLHSMLSSVHLPHIPSIYISEDQFFNLAYLRDDLLSSYPHTTRFLGLVSFMLNLPFLLAQ